MHVGNRKAHLGTLILVSLRKLVESLFTQVQTSVDVDDAQRGGCSLLYS